jgi:predicted adenylyl cyclase CyaB
MAREIEAKFRLEHVAALRARLAALGAQCIGTVLETNLILDTPARQLLSRGCGLRIRVAQPLDEPGARRVTLTYKGPPDADLRASGIKAREEIETEAADDVRLVALFAGLSFAPVLYYEKRRENWHLAGAAVTLDELPELGWFVEIEAADVRVVESLRVQLGLGQTVPVTETYVELTARHGTPDADGTRGLRFRT